ncbi:Ig-like domain-containing protein, partial [Buttiauxella warmboldiae]
FTGTVEVQHDGSLGYRIPVTTTDLVSGQTVQATITTTDVAGNTATASAEHAVGVDMGAEVGITVHPVAGDDVINAAESAAATTPVTGTVSGDAKAGDTVTLTVNGHAFTGTVEVQHDGSLGYRIPVTTTDLVSGQTVQATITTTDAAGNTATASADHAVGVDMGAEVGITVHPVAGDDVINAAESAAATTPVTGTVSGDAKAGDTVTLTVNGQTFTGPVQDLGNGQLGYSIPVTTTDLVSGQKVHATITTTDAAGNTASASADHAVGVDREAEAGITVHPVTADGVINASESTESLTPVTGTVSGDAKAGDAVTLTVN